MILFEEALSNINKTYDQIASIAKEITLEYSREVDEIINYTSDHVNNLDNSQLRALITDLSFKAYSLGEAKEFSALRSECAEALMKEAMATEFNGASGTVDTKKNTALLNSSSEIVASLLYDTVASLLKTKSDECHRIVDTLKTVILTRNTEAKIESNINDNREGM